VSPWEPNRRTAVERRREGGRARELALVRRVTERLVSSLDFREALATLIDGATELLGVERGSILLLDRTRQKLQIEVARGLDPEVVARTCIPIGEGIAGSVAASGEAIVAEDVRTLAAWKPSLGQEADYADTSALCVPLALHGEVLGVMNFNHKRSGRPFAARDLDFAKLIANQAAVVLWSARLHRDHLDKQVIDRELAIARSIQERLMTREVPRITGFELAARQTMCREVGGDYYDFFQVHDGQLAIAIGDAAGHGIGSALVAAQVRAMLRECLGRGDGLARALERLSDQVHADTSPGMFMTLLVGLVDLDAHFFEFATTGHQMPILFREGRAIPVRRTGCNMPLGVARRQQFELEFPLGLRRDDLMVLVTDGILEAENHAGDEFGEEGVARALERSHRRGLEQILGELLRAVREHRGGELVDDVTVVLCRVLTEAPAHEPL